LAGTDESPGSNRKAAFAVLLLALACRLVSLTGDMLFDPIVYAQNAYNLLQGTFTLKTDSWFAHRLPVFAPLVPLYAVFGVGGLTSRAWPLLLSLAQVALVLWIGRRLFDRATAVLAGIIVALVPLDLVYGSVLQPDTIMAAFLTGAACFWIVSVEEPDRRPRLFPFLSGLCFALAVVTRENAAVLAVLYLVSLPWRRPRPGVLRWTVLGGLLVIVPLLVAYALSTGDPFFRLRIVAGAYGRPAMQEGNRFGFYPSLLPHVRHAITGFGLPLFALGTLGGLLRPNRPRAWLLLWALPVFLYLQFGSMSATQYVPILKRERFLAPLSAPLALLTASVLLAWTSGILQVLLPRRSHAQRNLVRTGFLSAILVLLAGNSLLIARDQRRQGQDAFRAFRSVIEAIQQEPGLPVLCDHWRTGYRLSYYLGFREGADFYRGGDDRRRMGRAGSFGRSRLGYLSWYPDSSRVPHAFIVLDDDALRQAQAAEPAGPTFVPGDIPAYAYSPPLSWTSRGRFGSFRVYRR
jgi:4-amino-4-deoxy-L-arabinose transferase-like glycosyltransferase